jgi:hypothetical protein
MNWAAFGGSCNITVWILVCLVALASSEDPWLIGTLNFSSEQYIEDVDWDDAGDGGAQSMPPGALRNDEVPRLESIERKPSDLVQPLDLGSANCLRNVSPRYRTNSSGRPDALRCKTPDSAQEQQSTRPPLAASTARATSRDSRMMQDGRPSVVLRVHNQTQSRIRRSP